MYIFKKYCTVYCKMTYNTYMLLKRGKSAYARSTAQHRQDTNKHLAIQLLAHTRTNGENMLFVYSTMIVISVSTVTAFHIQKVELQQYMKMSSHSHKHLNQYTSIAHKSVNIAMDI